MSGLTDAITRVCVATTSASTPSRRSRTASTWSSARGLSAADFADLDAAAREHGVGVVASGSFSLTAAMASAAALLLDA